MLESDKGNFKLYSTDYKKSTQIATENIWYKFKL